MKRSLKSAIEAGEFILAPGLHDMIAAVVSNKVGFDFVYASGYWMTASAYGLPDAGIATYTEMLARVESDCRTAAVNYLRLTTDVDPLTQLLERAGGGAALVAPA